MFSEMVTCKVYLKLWYMYLRINSCMTDIQGVMLSELHIIYIHICIYVHTHIFIYFGEGNDNPLQYSCLGNPMARGAWWATVHGVTKVGHNWATKAPPIFVDDYNKTNINTNLIQILFNPFHFVFHLCLLHLSAFCYIIRKKKQEEIY